MLVRFVKFKGAEDALNAVNCMSGYKIANKKLLCKLANAEKCNNPTANVYIKPLHTSWNEGKSPHTFAFR